MRLLFSAAILAVAVGAAASGSAAPGATPQTAAATAALVGASAPSGRVGRVSLVSGKVESRGQGDAQWSPAEVNDPVATGSILRTDPAARAEIRIGPDTIDLAGGTEITVTAITFPTAAIALAQGRIELDVRHLGAGETAEITLPRGSLHPLRPGRYDIDIGGGEDQIRVAAFGGAARVVGESLDVPIAAGDTVTLNVGAPAATIETVSPDDFANWCARQVIDDQRLAAPYFISREMTGYAALDAAGRWRATAKDGKVWVPNTTPAGWAPYRDGHWRWFVPWGWTWIDDQPWGFATSHYGRWVHGARGWAWVPGKWVEHPVWAPAVVAFLGTPGVGLSYAGGPGPAIAWFPLAPGETYWPNYTADIGYIRAVNESSVADLNAIRRRSDGEPPAAVANAHFANRLFASVVPRPIFTAGVSVMTALLTIPPERLSYAPAIMGAPRIGPPPPPPVRVASAPQARRTASAPHVEPRAKREAGRPRLVRAVAIRGGRFVQAARVRLVHLRLSTAAEASRLRRSLVLRIARVDHALHHRDVRKRVIRR